jgi:hypothetical protein
MGFSLRDALVLALLGALIVAAKMAIRLPIKVPGHSTIFWMFFLVLGKGLVPRMGSGAIMGLFSGILAALTGMGKQGVFVIVKFVVPGLALDLLSLPLFVILPPKRLLAKPWVGALLGALVNLTKLASNVGLGVLLDMPLERMEALVGLAIAAHIAFGGLGGLVASLALRRVQRLLPFSSEEG